MYGCHVIQRRLSQSKRADSSLSSETIAKHWTLSASDQAFLNQYRKDYRLHMAIQLCIVRLKGRFLLDSHQLPVQIVSYLTKQLGLEPTLTVSSPTRRATLATQRQQLLVHLGFKKYNQHTEQQLNQWLNDHARRGVLPQQLLPLAEQFLLDNRIVLPGITVIERKVITVCNTVHAELFDAIYQRLSPVLLQEMTELLDARDDRQRSYFSELKAYPPSATITSIKTYLDRYQMLNALDLSTFHCHVIDTALLDYLYKLAKQ